MRKAINKISVLALFAAGALLLTACHTKNAAQVTVTESTAAESTVVDESIPSTTEKQNVQASVLLDMLNFSLPEGTTLRRDSEDRRTFVSGNTEVGGVFLLDVDLTIFDDVLHYQDSGMPLVLDAMKKLKNSDWEWYTSSSSLYGLFEVNMGRDQQEYIAYVVRGNTACYIVWFDRSQISGNDEVAIMKSLTSTDITSDLNMVSNQAYADAIAESMAQEEYQFVVPLPEGMDCQKETNEGALFYQGVKLVGGYKIIHFEKGILPAASENHDLIVSRIKEYLSDQIDLSDFSGKVNDEGLITVQFSGDGVVYTHYLLTYGQVGTQYDVWFDESQVEQDTVNAIVDGAYLVPIS